MAKKEALIAAGKSTEEATMQARLYARTLESYKSLPPNVQAITDSFDGTKIVFEDVTKQAKTFKEHIEDFGKNLGMSLLNSLAFAAVGTAITLIYKGIKAANEYKQTLVDVANESKAKIGSNEKEVESLSKELEDLRDTLWSLKKIESPTLAEQDQTTELEKQNEELTHRIQILRIQNEELERQGKLAGEAAARLANGDFDNIKEFWGVLVGNYYDDYGKEIKGAAFGALASEIKGDGSNFEIPAAYSAIDKLVEAEQRLAELQDTINVGIVSDEEIKEYDTLKATIVELRGNLATISQDLENMGTEESIALLEKISYVTQDAGTKTQRFFDVWKTLDEEQINQLKELAQSGELTSASLEGVVGKERADQFNELTGSIEGTVREIANMDAAAQRAEISLKNSLAKAFAAIKDPNADIKKVIGVLSTGNIDEFQKLFIGEDGQKYLESLINKFPQLEDELRAVANGFMGSAHAARAFSDALAFSTIDSFKEKLSSIVELSDKTSDSFDRFKLREAIEGLGGDLPGLSLYANMVVDGYSRIEQAALSASAGNEQAAKSLIAMAKHGNQLRLDKLAEDYKKAWALDDTESLNAIKAERELIAENNRLLDSMNLRSKYITNNKLVIPPPDTADLEKAIDSVDRLTNEGISNIISKFPQLRDEIQAYIDHLITGEQLQQEFNAALTQFRADSVASQLDEISNAAEQYGKNNYAVIEAVEELDSIVPGLSATLIDENGVLRENAASALSSASALFSVVAANKELAVQSSQLDLSNAKKELDELREKARTAAVYTFAMVEAQKRLDAAQAQADSIGSIIEQITGALNNYKWPTSKGDKKDKLLEAYQDELDRLDHYLHMENITEENYYKMRLAALEKFLKDKEKYQDQWWAYEEAHYDWLKKQWEKARDERVKLLEEERDALLDAKEKEREAEEKAAKEEYEAKKKIHEDTIDLLEKEIDAYEEKVNRQKELLDRQSDARSHEQDVAESNKIIADLNAQLEEIKNDDSAKAAAKRAEIQEKLSEEIKRLEDKQYDWSVNKQKESLDDELDNYKKHHDKLIEEQEKLLDDLEKSYDATIESIKNKFEGLIDSLKEQFERMIQFQKEQEYATRPMPPATVEPIDSGKPSGGGGQQYHEVKQGESLSRIAKQHNTTVSELLRLNPEITNPNLIHPKQQIRLYHSGGVVTKKNQEDFDTITDLKPDETVAKLQVGEGVLTADQMAAAADRIKLYNKFRDFISGSDYIAKSMPNAIANAGSGTPAGTNIVNNNTPSIVMNNEIHLANTDNDSMNKLEAWTKNTIDTAVKEMSKKFVGSVAFGSGLKIKPV